MELGRLDGRSFSKSIVKHVLPGPGFDLNQLNALFATNGLTQFDMIALSGTPLLFLPSFFVSICTVLLYFNISVK